MDRHEDLLECFLRVTDKLNVCPNRVWAVARENLPNLLPTIWAENQSWSGAAALPTEDETDKQPNLHELCTFDFCEYSQRDFTAVQQRHECHPADCIKLRGLFSEVALEKAALDGRSTVWELSGKRMLERDRPYMAISHVWSDGTGAGAWEDGQVNQCLYDFFQDIAKQFQCEGIWWDTICIPRDKAARNRAIRAIQDNYQDARITLVHDCFLRNWEWHPETACFGILMSPWFSRGWTALELASSRKVKVIFKGPYGGPIIKDLDEDILWKDDEKYVSKAPPRKEATAIIKLLRTAFERNNQSDDSNHGNESNLNNLLMVLGSRHTSWPKDMALISALLTGVQPAELQQTTYKKVLVAVRHLLHGHLFHDVATMSGGFSWCPISLLSIPLQPPRPLDAPGSYLTISRDGSLQGEWRLGRLGPKTRENISWGARSHPLIQLRIEKALEQHKRGDKRSCLLAEPEDGPVGRALLVTEMEGEVDKPTRYRYVGAVYFREHLPGEEWDTKTKTITISGDVNDQDITFDSHSGKTPRAMSTSETLQQAVWRRDFSKVQELIEKGVDLRTLDQIGRGALERVDRNMMDMLLAKTSLKDLEDFLKSRDGQGQTLLHRAAWAGATAIAKLLVKKGIDTTAGDNDGNLALHLAARMGFTPIVRLLLGLDIYKDKRLVDAKSYNGLTSLHYAAMNGHEEVVQMLLESGADGQVKDRIGWTPLHHAAGSGNTKAMQLLLGQLRDMTQDTTQDTTGWTLLHIAAMNGHGRAVEFLKNEANENAQDNHGWTPRHFADINMHPKAAKLLPAGDNSDANPPIEMTPLHLLAIDNPRRLIMLAMGEETGAYLEVMNQLCTPLLFAAEHGLHTAIHRLLRMGRKVKGSGKWMQTQLSLAAMNGHVTTVQVLLEKGADPNAEDIHGQTPLYRAAEKGHEGVVQLLLEKGADPNAGGDIYGQTPLRRAAKKRYKGSQTPLYQAVEKGHEGVVQLLLEKGADPDVKDVHGQPPLYRAAVEKGHKGISQLLLEKGADPNMKDKYSRTLLYRATEKGHMGVIQLLLEKGAKPDIKEDIYGRTPLHQATEKRHEGVIQLLLEKGAKPDVKDVHGQTPLYQAVEKGHEGVVQLLLEKGADPDVKDNYSWTPLCRATKEGHKGIIQLLLEKGADPNVKDNCGWTPLYRAAAEGHEGVIQLLLKKGADPDVKDEYDRTPLHRAAAEGHEGVIQLLLEKGADPDMKDKFGRTPLRRATRHGHKGVIQLLLTRKRRWP